MSRSTCQHVSHIIIIIKGKLLNVAFLEPDSFFLLFSNSACPPAMRIPVFAMEYSLSGNWYNKSSIIMGLYSTRREADSWRTAIA